MQSNINLHQVILRAIHRQMFIPKLSLGMLGVLLLLMLCPIVQEQTQAVELTPGQSQAENTTQARILVQSTISLALQNRVDVEVVPKSNGNFSAATARMNVATNNSTGYGIYLGTVNQKSELTLSTDATSVIGALPTAVSESDFPNNTWGYRLVGTNLENSTEDLLYQAVPGETLKVRNVDVPNALAGQQDSYELSFGTKVDTTVRAGLYQNQVIVSVVANPRELQNFSELTFMQEMTPEICQSLKDLPAEQQTGQLIDQRDGKSYWVSYLADGNCWMTQNLALDLSTEKPLTPSDSDVTEEWVPTQSTFVSPNLNIPSDFYSSSAYSWNFGTFVLATPERDIACGSSADDKALASGQSLVGRCSDLQLVDNTWLYQDASQGAWNTTTNATVGGPATVYIGLVTVNKDNKTYDSHYLIGNYYQVDAAAAGSHTNAANQSICPKGWKLPTNSPHLYRALFAAYGYPPTATTVTLPYNGAPRIESAPLSFVRAGSINQQILESVGRRVELSSASRDNELYVYGNNMRFNATRETYNGLTIRCVAR